jgi:hypothetical protein
MNKTNSVVSAVATGIAAAALATTGHAQTPPQTGPNSPACANNTGIGGNIEPMQFTNKSEVTPRGESVAVMKTYGQGQSEFRMTLRDTTDWLRDYKCTDMASLAHRNYQLPGILDTDADQVRNALEALASATQSQPGPRQAQPYPDQQPYAGRPYAGKPYAPPPPYAGQRGSVGIGVQARILPPSAPVGSGVSVSGFTSVPTKPDFVSITVLDDARTAPPQAVFGLSDHHGIQRVFVTYGVGVGPNNSDEIKVDVAVPKTFGFTARTDLGAMDRFVQKACATNMSLLVSKGSPNSGMVQTTAQTEPILGRVCANNMADWKRAIAEATKQWPTAEMIPVSQPGFAYSTQPSSAPPSP